MVHLNPCWTTSFPHFLTATKSILSLTSKYFATSQGPTFASFFASATNSHSSGTLPLMTPLRSASPALPSQSDLDDKFDFTSYYVELPLLEHTTSAPSSVPTTMATHLAALESQLHSHTTTVKYLEATISTTIKANVQDELAQFRETTFLTEIHIKIKRQSKNSKPPRW